MSSTRSNQRAGAGAVGMVVPDQQTTNSQTSALSSSSSPSSSSSSASFNAVNKFRAEQRETFHDDYNGQKHFFLLLFGACSTMCVHYYLISDTIFQTPSSWLTFVITFFISNYLEYAAHRYQLHHPTVHTRHALIHHRFFTYSVMEWEHWNDVVTIFFPIAAPYIVFYCILPIIASPLLLLSRTVYCTYLFTGAAYYAIYETLHLMYHSPPTSIMGKLPFVEYLRKHHQVHHRQTLMREYNFNITWPIFDLLLGTMYRGEEENTLHLEKEK